MKILLIVLAVLAALLVLLLLLLLLGSAGIRIIYRGQLRVVLKVLGLRFRLYPEKTPRGRAALRREAKRKKRKRRRRAEKRLRRRQRAAAGEPTPGLPENLRMITALVRLAVQKTRGHIRIRVRRFHIRIATGDAARTAILYGAAVGAAAPLLQWLHSDYNAIERGDGDMTIEPDYLAQKSDAEVDIELGMRLIRGLMIAVSLFSAYRGEKELAIRRTRSRLARRAARARAKARRRQQAAPAARPPETPAV